MSALANIFGGGKKDPQLSQTHYSNPADGYWWKPEVSIYIEPDNSPVKRHIFVQGIVEGCRTFLETLGYKIIFHAYPENTDLCWYWESASKPVPGKSDGHTFTGYETPGYGKKANMPWAFAYVEVRCKKVSPEKCIFLGAHEIGIHGFGVCDHSHDKKDVGHPTSYVKKYTTRDMNTLRAAANRRFADKEFAW